MRAQLAEHARVVASGFMYVMAVLPRRYPDRAVIGCAIFAVLLSAIGSAQVTAAIPDKPPVTVRVVVKDQSRFIDPELARAIFPNTARPLVCLDCPIVPKAVATVPVEKPPEVKAGTSGKPKAKNKKRSDVPTGMQLASVTGVDHEPAYETPERAAWPRVTPEQEAVLRICANAQTDSSACNEPDSHPADAWAKGEIDAYLCAVYRRTTVKKDNSGDFTWKDPAAAKRKGMGVCEYVIGGMSPDFREQLYAAGKKMDADGVRWSILSAFRDDYRQAIASGFKARTGNSLHGGSRVTGGYGDGRAIDIAAVPGTSIREVFAWLDKHGRALGLIRPMPRYDPAHVQPVGGWRAIAAKLRLARTGESVEVTAAKRPQKRRQRVARR